MPMANIACARAIATRGQRLRRAVAALLLLACALPAAAAPPAAAPNADPAFPFSNEIAAFARANSAGAPVRDATLFLGSSSIRLWDIAGSFRDIDTVNRGFGGATTAHVLHYYKRLLPPLPPRAIILYVGENDLAAGVTPQAVTRDLLTLIGKLRADYPRAAIACLSLKPSPMRWTLSPKMAEVNAAIAGRARKEGFAYLDVGSALLAPDGLPDASLFRPDGLHMNGRGYQRWTALVDAWLDRVSPPGAGESAS
ncbi:GDSL-type esterase/lipase family protein [Sphingobium sp. HBC34]|uniref:GDSL-type esterase/lipase family protein n=1 Tax=Sphingobium cyanobacteriorum TaxID=3063954 RepID=A0ABT8ZI91_9SPHN|nr:GDSL-type esterase/lipase family protein [Sphingobium sp. HBC34]MDO7834257.1 GDSL-type esterase/lipase family protein [Sphingobium sp. HBC34]